MDFFLKNLDKIIPLLIAFVGALTSLIKVIIDLIKIIQEKKKDISPGPAPRPSLIKKIIPTLIIFILCSIVLSIIIIWIVNIPPLSLNTKITNEAWKAFEKKEYEKAIFEANKCIDRFEYEAITIETEFENKNNPIPPKGIVNNSQKKQILLNGVLNDVAACYYILGRSLNELGNEQEAIEAFKNVLKFKYARVWDDKRKTFWSPIDAANNEINAIKRKSRNPTNYCHYFKYA